MERAQVALARLPDQDESEAALQGAVLQAIGQIGGVARFIHAGDRVLLKPNQTLWMPERSGSTTSPRLIRVLIRLAFESGAKEVWVAEAAGHAQSSRTVMTNSGMVHGVQGTGAHLIYLEEVAQKVFDFGAGADALRYMPAPEIMERADVIINVPKAKTHFVDPISCACKNWVGIVPMAFRLWLQKQVDPYYRATGLMLKRFRPHLTVVDGAWAGEGQGPGGNDPFWWGWILASSDPVAMDVVVARCFGFDPVSVRMTRTAADLGVGQMDPNAIDVLGASIAEATRKVTPADPSVHRFPCNVIVGDQGATIEGTLGHWKTIADGWLGVGLWRLFTLRGRPTFLFGDADDPEFEAHLQEGPYVVLDDAAQDTYKYDPRVTFVPGSPVPQSYMQNEMVEGMGFGGIYQAGLKVEQMIERWKGRHQARG